MGGDAVSGTEIVIAVTGCSVTVKADDSLDEVAKRALDIYAAVVPPDVDRPGPAIGFSTERRWSRQEPGPFGAVK